jgi:Ca2+-binding EF-hand superfamily protein
LRRERAGRRFGAGRPRDSDGDGRINREEFIAGEAPLFNRFDANRNGVLEPAEIESIRSRMGARRAERPPSSQTQ